MKLYPKMYFIFSSKYAKWDPLGTHTAFPVKWGREEKDGAKGKRVTEDLKTCNTNRYNQCIITESSHDSKY